LLTDHRGILA